MTFETWMLGIIVLFVGAYTLVALIRGSAQGESRGTDPTGYWLVIALLVTITGLHLWMLTRALDGERLGHVGAGFFFAPACLYLIVKWLRAGEIVWGNNRFPRRERAQPYWTILFLTLVGFVFFAGVIVYQAVNPPL
jgi:uncharacterized membrane protein YhdT